MSEEYQLLRYYIPGSLFLIYLSVLIIPNSGNIILYVREFSILELIGVFLGFFTISPPIGYIIYSIYDWTLYRRISKWKKKRTALQLIEEWAKNEKVTLDNVKKKELIDFAFYFSLKDSNFKISDQIGETIRGFWSHFNARVVCSIYVPLFVLSSILITNYILNWNIFFPTFPTIISGSIIMIISVFLGIPAWGTMKEAFALEESVVRLRKQEILKYLRTLNPNITSSNSKKLTKS